MRQAAVVCMVVAGPVSGLLLSGCEGPEETAAPAITLWALQDWNLRHADYESLLGPFQASQRNPWRGHPLRHKCFWACEVMTCVDVVVSGPER